MSTNKAEPFYLEAGAGPGVVCLHANASTSAQWRPLMEHLSPRFRVLAPDLSSAGKSPQWHPETASSLRDEVELIEPVLARAGTPLALVGHSYGGAVALIAALANPGRVRALALYEPTLFAVLEQTEDWPDEADGIRDMVVDAHEALERGDREAAAHRFIDYWMGEGSWARFPGNRKAPIIASARHIPRWGHALFTEPTPLEAFRALDVPVLYMIGKRSRASAKQVAKHLVAALPRVHVVEFEALGHMGPITHPAPVNESIARLLETV